MGYYLSLYNLAQLLGWSALLLTTLSTGSFTAYQFPLVQTLLKIFQTLMLLEIIHSLFNISGSPVVPTTLQIFSRIWALYGVIELVPNSCWITSVIVMWSFAEIIRYGHYLIANFGRLPRVLLWIRYSAFIVLYPVGVFSEMMTLRDAYEKICQCCPRVFSFEMPNEYNFSFDYLYFIWLVIVPGYVLGFPFLYGYMLQQRKRRLTKVD